MSKNWKIVPGSMTVIHRCLSVGSCGWGTVEVVEAVVHATRPAEALPIRADWTGPVLESVAACGCRRWRGIEQGYVQRDGVAVIRLRTNRDEVVNSWASPTQ